MMRLLRAIYRFMTSHSWGYAFFWAWNLFFGIVVLTGFLPGVLVHIVPAVIEGLIPANFFVLSVIFFIVPFIFMYVGYRYFRRQPRALLGLIYGVEWPIMAILSFRFFAVKQLTLLLTFVFVVAGIAIAVYSWQLLDDRLDKRGSLSAILRLSGLSSLLMLGVYFASIPAILLPPAARMMAHDLWWSLRSFNLGDFLFSLVGEIVSNGIDAFIYLPMLMAYFTIFILFSIVFMTMPIGIPLLYGRAWWKGVQAAALRLGKPITAAITGVTAVLLTVSFIILSRQPQLEAHQLLQQPPTTIEEAKIVASQEDKIRSGLVEAYLAAYRYPAVLTNDNIAYDMWSSGHEEMRRNEHGQRIRTTMNPLVSDETATEIGHVFARLMTPFTYQQMDAEGCELANERGSCWTTAAYRWEADQATKQYQAYFDTPINEGENAIIVDAVRQTWNPDTAMSQWQAVDDREIWVKQQDVMITEHGDWAEVELHEVYVNQTFDLGEVVYFFNLPESAVVTTVWLGDDEDEKLYEHVVAPRGAAQQVYQEQVQVTRRDPALVEQIGPSQYRLRVYPVPQKETEWDEGLLGWDKTNYIDGESLHMSIKYNVLRTDEGWPLPTLTEKRNAYWTGKSERTINSQPIRIDDWLPAYAPIINDVVPHQGYQVDFPNGQTVLAIPEHLVETPDGNISTLNAAVVLDQSYSMRNVSHEVADSVEAIDEMVGDIDLFLTAADNRGEQPVWLDDVDLDALDDLFYFGGQHAAQLLQQYDELRNDVANQKQYDVVFVITDDSGYELGEVDFAVPRISEPVWMVHLGGAPIGYDDDTMEVLQASGGGSARSIADAMTRLAISQAADDSDAYQADQYDGYRWITLPTEEADNADLIVDPMFAPMAARRYIISEMMKNRGDLSNVDQLREIHNIAVENSIVTPYSSMIVLVDQQQKDRLKELSEQDDAFEREFEEVGQTEQMEATAVPEPEEWLLIIAATCMIGYYLRKNHLENKLLR